MTIAPPRGWEGSAFRAKLSDPDGNINTSGIGWQWPRSTNRSSWVDIAGATFATYTAVADDVGHYLRATASPYEDRRGGNKHVSGFLRGVIGETNPAVNRAPSFSDTEVSRSIAEGAGKGRSIGAPVAATDFDSDDVLTYSLSGQHADPFDIDPATGQLLTKDILVVERQETYEVTVGVHDGFDADYNPDHNPDASVDVTITVTGGTVGTVTSSGGGSSGGGGGGPPANSAPVFRDADGAEITETTRMITEDAVPGAEIGEPVAATGADEDALTYTLSGDDAASFAIDASTGQLTTVTTLDHETKSVYTVVVTATDPSGATVDVPVIITVTDVEFDCSSGNAVPEAADNPGLVADCEALLEARARLVGTAALNWSEDTPITEWDGVRLGGTPQRVVGCTFHAATWTELYRPAWAVCRR